jgi:surfeit locus 1 family protein
VTTFRPALWPTVATIAAIALFVVAGFWQRDRMQQKLALGLQVEAAAHNAPVPLPTASDWPRWRYRRVIVEGTFDAAHQILVDNKVHEGHAGYYVVTPLVQDDGRTVLVNRGWIAGGERKALPSVPPPQGRVTVTGRIDFPPSKYFELKHDTVSGALWQNLDLARYTQATGVAVLPIVVEQTQPIVSGDTLARDWPAPDFGADKHWMYMMQWFLFAALAAAFWLYFAFRRRR